MRHVRTRLNRWPIARFAAANQMPTPETGQEQRISSHGAPPHSRGCRTRTRDDLKRSESHPVWPGSSEIAEIAAVHTASQPERTSPGGVMAATREVLPSSHPRHRRALGHRTLKVTAVTPDQYSGHQDIAQNVTE